MIPTGKNGSLPPSGTIAKPSTLTSSMATWGKGAEVKGKNPVNQKVINKDKIVSPPAGDWNTSHWLWGAERCNRRGRALANLVLSTGMSSLVTGGPKRFQ